MFRMEKKKIKAGKYKGRVVLLERLSCIIWGIFYLIQRKLQTMNGNYGNLEIRSHNYSTVK